MVPGARRKKKRLFALQTGTCVLCGMPMARGDATFEHLVPRSLGGTNTTGNLALSHKSCNNRRGAAPLTHSQEWRVRYWFACEPTTSLVGDGRV